MPAKTKASVKTVRKLNSAKKTEKKLSRYCRSGRVLW